MGAETTKKSFWSSLPGILTGVAAVLAASATLYTALQNDGDENGPAPTQQEGRILLVAPAPLGTGAEVYLDNEYKGHLQEVENQAQSQISVPPGKFHVRVTKSEYEDFDTEVEVQAGQTAQLPVLLQKPAPPPADFGEIFLVAGDASSKEGQVFLDGELRGQLQQSGSTAHLRLAGIRPGPRQIRVTKRGYQPFTREVNVSAGKVIEVNFHLLPLEAQSGEILLVAQSPSGRDAEAYLNNAYQGRLQPRGNGAWLPIRHVAAGVHAVRVMQTNYAPFEQRVRVAADKQSVVRVALKPSRRLPGLGGSVTRPEAGLAAPRQLSPESRHVFSHLPRKTVLRWEAVKGAASYQVEIDCYCNPKVRGWCTESAGKPCLAGTSSTTRYQFTFPGAGPGRWRVWAVGVSGQAGAKSDWRAFAYRF